MRMMILWLREGGVGVGFIGEFGMVFRMWKIDTYIYVVCNLKIGEYMMIGECCFG